jgi:hypothetical protein
MNFIKKFFYKKWLAIILEREAWNYDLSAEYTLSLIDDILKLKQAAEDELEKLEVELKTIDLTDNRRETRERKKVIQKNIEKIRNKIEQYQLSITNINKSAINNRQQAAILRNKAKFFRKA